MDDKTKILVDALNTIADYDYHSGKEGICPYGCDTPNIARQALQAYKDATQPDDAAELTGIIEAHSLLQIDLQNRDAEWEADRTDWLAKWEDLI